MLMQRLHNVQLEGFGLGLALIKASLNIKMQAL